MTGTTYITTHKRVSPCPRVHNKLLLLGLFLQNRHTTGTHANLLMRLTCNKGLTNPEYKCTQQELTDERKRLRICRLTRNQDKSKARIKINFT